MAYRISYTGDPAKDDPKKKKKEEDEAKGRTRSQGEKRTINPVDKPKYDIPDVSTLRGTVARPAVMSYSPGPEPGSMIDHEGTVIPYGKAMFPDNWSHKTNSPKNTSLGYDSPNNVDWWKTGDPIFAGPGKEHAQWEKEYNDFFTNRIASNLTPDDIRNIKYATTVAKNPDMTPEENYAYQRDNYIRNRLGGFPDYNSFLDYSGILKREQQGDSEDKQSSGKSTSVDTEASKRAAIHSKILEDESAKRKRDWEAYKNSPRGQEMLKNAAEAQAKEQAKFGRQQARVGNLVSSERLVNTGMSEPGGNLQYKVKRKNTDYKAPNTQGGKFGANNNRKAKFRSNFNGRPGR